MLPMNDGGALSALVCGVLFGYVLENAGFGSPKKLTAQFKLTDWSVFKVMFTAIVVAAGGLWLLKLAGLINPDSIFVPSALLVAAAIGGVLVGSGFAIGGYCPGTSVVGPILRATGCTGVHCGAAPWHICVCRPVWTCH
jgi:hypothetical protein